MKTSKFLPFVALIFILVCGVKAQPSFSFEGNYNYSLNKPNNDVFAITPDGKRAVTLTFVTSPSVGGKIESFDTVSGEKFDSKFVGFGPSSVKIAELSDGIRVVVITTEGGPRTVTIYDLSEKGVFTQRARTQLTKSTADTNTNILLSPDARVGFVRVNQNSNNQLVSFSLDDGQILDRLNTSSSSVLEMFEDANRRIIVSGSSNQLEFINALDPSNIKSLGLVSLPEEGANLGAFEIFSVFSQDGQYVFAGGSASLLHSIDTSTLQVVDSYNEFNYSIFDLDIFDNGKQRTIVARVSENDGDFFKGLAVFDASDPTNLTLINKIAIQDFFRLRDFKISNDGKRLFVVDDFSFKAYSVPQLNVVLNIPLFVNIAFRVDTFGQEGRVLAAYGSKNNFGATIYSIPNKVNSLANFDTDGKTDLSVFRAESGVWYWINSLDGSENAFQFGQTEDIPVSQDYDGDGIADFAVFRPNISKWFIYQSSDNTVQEVIFGRSNDQLVPDDYDGDGKADVAIFRPNPNRWRIIQSSDGEIKTVKFGFGRGKPVRGDFDADNIADYAYFNSAGVWQIKYSGGGNLYQQFGLGDDIPLSGDFDFDGKNDLAVFRKSDRTWYIQQSSEGFKAVQFGLPTDKLVPADYDGDGKTDIAVFRPSNSTWYIISSLNNSVSIFQYGLENDVPIALQK